MEERDLPPYVLRTVVFWSCLALVAAAINYGLLSAAGLLSLQGRGVAAIAGVALWWVAGQALLALARPAAG